MFVIENIQNGKDVETFISRTSDIKSYHGGNLTKFKVQT